MAKADIKYRCGTNRIIAAIKTLNHPQNYICTYIFADNDKGMICFFVISQ